MFKCEVCGSVEQDRICPGPERLSEDVINAAWYWAAMTTAGLGKLIRECRRARAAEEKLVEGLRARLGPDRCCSVCDWVYDELLGRKP